MVSMSRNLFLEVSLNFNFFAKWPILFKMGVGALLNFTRKCQPKTFCKDYKTDCYYYLDLHRKFELSSLIGSTVIPLFVFETNVPIEMCTTQSSLTPVQTLWQAKRTLTMSAMGKVLKENSRNFVCLSIMWFSFGLVTFKRQISDDVKEIIIKRPRLNLDQNCHFHKNKKSKVNGTFKMDYVATKP